MDLTVIVIVCTTSAFSGLLVTIRHLIKLHDHREERQLLKELSRAGASEDFDRYTKLRQAEQSLHLRQRGPHTPVDPDSHSPPSTTYDSG